MRRPECVVDVGIAERAESVGKCGIVLRLARLEAQVLQEQHVAGTERAGRGPHVVAHDTGRQRCWGPEELTEAPGDRLHRVTRIPLALRTAEM